MFGLIGTPICTSLAMFVFCAVVFTPATSLSSPTLTAQRSFPHANSDDGTATASETSAMRKIGCVFIALTLGLTVMQQLRVSRRCARCMHPLCDECRHETASQIGHRSN